MPDLASSRALLVSHRFNPGHLSHLLANYKLLHQAGVNVSFRWNRKFEFQDDECKRETAKFRDLGALRSNDVLIVWFPSLRALADMVVVKWFSKGSVIYVLHEPFESVMSYLAAGFGIFKTLKITIVGLVNRLMVAASDKVILPSEKSFEAFSRRYAFKGPFTKIPLMFDDEVDIHQSAVTREYVSYIGTIAADHAFDQFVEFVIASLSQQPAPEYIFLIATRSVIPDSTQSALRPFARSGRLIISSGKPLSNAEINYYFAKSWVVWNAYKRSMQSGILPKAYMFGTPTITSDVNRSEFVVNHAAGIEISSRYDNREIALAVNEIISSFPKYSMECRRLFLETFYYKALSCKFLAFVYGHGEKR